jgi:TonB family protein
MIPTLKFSCSKDWSKMKIGLVSRHCERCEKEVMDFTQMSREEVLQYLLQNRNKQVCGRMLQSQIDYHHEDLVITIESLLSKNKNSNLAFYLLTIGSLALAGCKPKPQTETQPVVTIVEPTIVTAEEAVEIDSTTTDNLYTITSISADSPFYRFDPSILNISQEASIKSQLITLGLVAISEPEDPLRMYGGDPLALDQPPIIAEVMPEFVGGFDSLLSFMRKNVKYPEFEKKNSIEGTTYVSVIIDSDGKVTNPFILKSSNDNFDKEALRVVNLMPDWKPGENDGKKIAVRYTLPVKFKI